MSSELAVRRAEVLGPDGLPFHVGGNGHGGNGHGGDGPSAQEAVALIHAVARAYAAYPVAMQNIAASSKRRASEPFNNNPWVFACAMVIATAMSQSPYAVFEEDEETQTVRKSVAVKRGRWTGAFPSGMRRRAFARYCTQRCRRWGLVPRGLAPDLDHWISGLMLRPNPLMSARQLWFLTNVHMAVRGEAFWLLVDEEGRPTTWWGGKVAAIWPVAPNLVTEIVERNALVGWRVSLPRGVDPAGPEGNGRRTQAQQALDWRGSGGWTFSVMPDEVVHFYDPDPENPLRGISTIGAAAADIYLDAAATRNTINTINQGGVPPAVLVHKGPMKPFKNKTEEEEFQKKWMQEHSSDVDREKGIGLLTGGWDYVRTSLSPRDMEFMEQKKWGRDEICAVMNVPKSLLSITDKINYATDLSQKRSFYETNILPRQEGIEATLDATLTYAEPDTVVGMFDNSRVEALKVGIADKLTAMNTATGSNIHMPPRQAAELVGLDMPSYDGDELCALPAGLVTWDAVLDGAAAPPAGPPAGPPAPGLPGKPPPHQGPAQGAPPQHPPSSVPAAGSTGTSQPVKPGETPPPKPQLGSAGDILQKIGVDRQARGGYNAAGRGPKVHINGAGVVRAWAPIIRKIQAPYENRFRRAWRRFVQDAKRDQLRRFDARTKELGSIFAVIKAGSGVDPDEVLLDLADLQAQLAEAFDPIYTDELGDVVQYMQQEVGGITQFTPDDPDIAAAIERRREILLDSAPGTMLDDVRGTVLEGIDAGQTVQEIRLAIAEQFDASAGTGKTLTVARTESAGFMNEARNAVFDKAGITRREWVTAGDEHVRSDHREFGQAGPQDAGYNYLELVHAEDEGVLEYPGDPRAPAGQVINCRCVQIAG